MQTTMFTFCGQLNESSHIILKLYSSHFRIGVYFFLTFYFVTNVLTLLIYVGLFICIVAVFWDAEPYSWQILTNVSDELTSYIIWAFIPDDGGKKLLRNFCQYVPEYKVNITEDVHFILAAVAKLNLTFHMLSVGLFKIQQYL